MVVLECAAVTVRRGGSALLANIDWQVHSGQHWVVIGPNGAGKTTLLSIAAGRLFPTSGTVRVLGEELGAVDLAEIRPRIGWASAALAADFPSHESALDVVMTGAHAVTGRWREEYGDVDADRAKDLLDRWGLGTFAKRTFGTLSEGERKRALIARALMADPEVLLLDEPGAGLDLGGREDLLARLTELAHDPRAPTIIMVTHHVEEIPQGFSHALLLAEGQVQSAGPIADVITAGELSRMYGMHLRVEIVEERRFAMRAARPS